MYDDDQRVPWAGVFGNRRPVEVEIGPGSGETLFAAAAAAPERNFFAIERTWAIVETLGRGAARRGLDNVRAVAGDARCVIAHLVPDASVAAYHVYFPDPWPKTRHRHRRLINREFAAQLRRTLVPGGVLHLATDLRPLLDDYASALLAAGLAPDRNGASQPRPRTHFERRYATTGTHQGHFVRPGDA